MTLSSLTQWNLGYSRRLVVCGSNLLETGDPATNIGFAMGANVYFQGPNPDGTQSADGYYHPTDEAFLPWFLRVAPNNISEPTQGPSTNVGRYTLMGDLNPFPGLHQPATGCNCVSGLELNTAAPNAQPLSLKG